jgi:hypothetical protein
MLRQDQADQFRPPVGMLLAEGLGLQHQRGRGVRAGRGAVIGRRGGLATVVAPQVQHVIDGAQREVETLCQGGRG